MTRARRSAGASGSEGRAELYVTQCQTCYIGQTENDQPSPNADADTFNQYLVSIGETAARRVNCAGPELAVRLPRFQVTRVSHRSIYGGLSPGWLTVHRLVPTDCVCAL